MKLPSSLTAVTPFSKLLALFLFITLPFVGFYLGMRYQEMINLTPPMSSYIQPPPTPTLIPIPTVIIGKSLKINTSRWKIYKDLKHGFEIKYPPSWHEEPNCDGKDTMCIATADFEQGEGGLSEGGLLSGSVIALPTEKPSMTTLDDFCAPHKEYPIESDCTKTNVNSIEVLRRTGDQFALYADGGILHDKEVTDGFRLYSYLNSQQETMQQTFVEVLSTFRFTDLNATPAQQRCAKYTRNGIAKTVCATCGNGVCEPYETCTATDFRDDVPPLADCGTLYCGKDCQK